MPLRGLEPLYFKQDQKPFKMKRIDVMGMRTMGLSVLAAGPYVEPSWPAASACPYTIALIEIFAHTLIFQSRCEPIRAPRLGCWIEQEARHGSLTIKY